MLFTFLLLILSLAAVIQSADIAIKYASRLAESLALPKYIVGFLIVAVISILPETFISVTSAVEGIPSFGLGTLFGSNVADLTLVFTLVIFFAGRNLKIESKLIKNRFLYIGALTTPLILGLNGHYSRLEGAALIAIGVAFYYVVLKKNAYKVKTEKRVFSPIDILALLVGMGLLLASAHFTVSYGVEFANQLGVNPMLIGMFVVALGTVLPELIFSIKAARKRHDDLALGDILGTVIADATIVVGIVAVISPFAFESRLIYITGLSMMLAAIILFSFMKTGRVISKREALALLAFYCLFIATELLVTSAP